MAVELKVPSVGESVYEVTIGEWFKAEGDLVRKDEPVVALESDKASFEVPAPQTGRITRHLKKRGDSANVGEVIAMIEAGAEAGAEAPAPAAAAQSVAATAAAPAAGGGPGGEARVMPAARATAERLGLDASQVPGTGPGGRVLKEDVLRHAQSRPTTAYEPASASAPPATSPSAPTAPAPAARQIGGPGREEEVVPMTPLRRKIAERLVESQRTAALLTTFNEVDMSEVVALRKQFQEAFQAKHGVKLGFMSFFVKAAIEALKAFPQLNAEIRGTDIVFKNYFDIGVAVGGGRGLVVPVIRGADRLGFAEVEKTIADFGARAKANKISPDELQGGTFTISNGGVYGSLMSTPIVNPPQVAILGMHAIQERPVVRDGQIVIRPMMYLAMTYDHRLIDGRESVTFLKTIKDCVEHPARILLEV